MNKKRVKMHLQRFYSKVFSLFHKVQNKVLFESFMGKQYSDNPRAVSEKLHEMYPEHRIVWVLNNHNTDVPSYISIVSKNSLAFYRELSTSFAYVTNEGMTPNLNKRKKQFFVQTWHGDRGFKKVLYDVYENGKREIPIIDEKITDLCVAGSQYGESKYRSAFRYSGRVLRVGTPRNDCLVNPDTTYRDTIKRRLGIASDVKVLLYAPTYRGYQEKSDIQVDLNEAISILEKKSKSKWVCLIRAHASTKGGFKNAESNWKDVSKYPDIADLLLIADMLFTDFSSCSGDFIIQKKPVILVLFDKEVYMNNCRTFKVPLEETGYFIATNQIELNKILLSMSDNDYAENCQIILDYYKTTESGHASQAVCEEIHAFYVNYLSD